MSVPNATHCLGTLFLSIQRNYQKIAKLSPQILRQKRFPFSEMGSNPFSLSGGLVLSTFGAKKTPFMDVDDPRPAVYGLAALSKAWLPELPNPEFFHPLKNPKFFFVDENPPTTEVTTTRFIIIFWCCSCLNIQRNVMNPKPGVLYSSKLLPPFLGIFGILKTSKFQKKGSLKP